MAGWPPACCASSTTCSPSAASPGGCSCTPATRSAAPSARAAAGRAGGWLPRRCCAPGRGSALRSPGDQDRAGSCRRHVVVGDGVGAALVRVVLLERQPARGRRCCTRCRTPPTGTRRCVPRWRSSTRASSVGSARPCWRSPVREDEVTRLRQDCARSPTASGTAVRRVSTASRTCARRGARGGRADRCAGTSSVRRRPSPGGGRLRGEAAADAAGGSGADSPGMRVRREVLSATTTSTGRWPARRPRVTSRS